MIETNLMRSMQFRTVPDSAGVTGTNAYTINLSSTAGSGAATSDGANGTYSDTNEVGRQLTLIDSAQTWTNMVGRNVVMTSGELSGKVLQILKVSGSTATLRYVSDDDAITISEGDTYTIRRDYAPGQKIAFLGVRQYNKGSAATETGAIFRVVQNGGTMVAFLLNSSTAVTHDASGMALSAEHPLVIDPAAGDISIVFQKSPTIGTTTWGTNVRFILSFVAI